MASDAPEPLVVQVDDLGSGLWGGRVKQAIEARVPLRNAVFGLSRAAVAVDELPIRYLDARDPALARLRQLSHSPAAWFRCPFAHVVLVSCLEYEDYKRDLRLRLRAMADTETAAPGQPELLFVYVRPAAADVAAKGPAKVFDSMRRDLNRRRERCVRLDPAPQSSDPSTPALLGLEEYEKQLKDAIRAAFEARAAAYTEEVRRLMANRLDPSWSFPTLFLVKDGLAAMLESAGLLEDALREYSELEAAYLDSLQLPHQPRRSFGGKPAAEDEAAALWAPWAATRSAAALPDASPEWAMRQALFASQARLLLKLHRHAEVADRGLKFVQSFGGSLAQQQKAGALPPLLREAWAFASCVSLAAATSRQQAARAEEKRRTDHGGSRSTRKPRASELAGADAAAAARGLSPGAPAGHTSLQIKVGPASSEAEPVSSPSYALAGLSPQVDWQLGVLPSRSAAVAAAVAAVEGAAGGRGGPGREGGSAPPGSAALYCLLGKLYCTARSELLRLGAAAGLDVPKSATPAGVGTEPHRHAVTAPAAAPAAAATAAGPATTPQRAAAAEAPAQMAPAPSSSDMAQVDLGGSQQAQQAQQAAQQAQQQPTEEQAAAAVGLESSAEGQAEGAVSAAADQLQRLSLNRKSAGGGNDSLSSSPHSTSTSTHHSFMAAGAVDAGHAVAASPHVTPRSDGQSDVCAIERQVVSLLGDRGGRTAAKAAALPPAPEAAAAAAAAATNLPVWLVHWRLRAALSSQQLFTELFIELSEAAAKCYSQCGHLRNAALLRADVADALVKAGQLERASELYGRQCRTFLREGWHALAAATLPKLAACQLAAGGAGLAQTAAALLSLPAPFRGGASQRQAACQLLLQAAALPDGGLGSGSSSRSAAGPGSPPAGTAAASIDKAVDLSAPIWAAPAKDGFSRFYGRMTADGAPLLLPPPGAPGGSHAAAVGDALALQIEVHSDLPVGLRLRDVSLTLGVLQEMTVIHSPRAASPLATLADARGSPGAAPKVQLGPSFQVGALSLALEHADSTAAQERYESQWQLVEELSCSLVAVSPCSGSGGGSGDSGSGLPPSLQPVRGEVELPPGCSLLTFLAAPVKRGLYKALSLRARLDQLPFTVSVHLPRPLWPALIPSSSGKAVAGSGRRDSRTGGAQLAAAAEDEAASGPRAEAVLMQVGPAQPRVELSLLAAGGSLIAGQEQWLGLALAPERDALHGARLELSWPLAPAAASGPAGLPPPVPRKASGLVPHHRSVQSHGGEMRLSPLGSSVANLPPSQHSYVRPEHRSAVLLGAGAASEGGQGADQPPRLLQVDGPTGPAAAWLLDGTMQQQLALPLVEEGRPICLWWRVTAGEVQAAPEQVHIQPAAPHQSARQVDHRRLAQPADPAALPAAVLDLPASLEYASGCQRSHSRVLGAAVRQPFTVASAARALPGGTVALQCTLTSNMAVPARLAKLTLEPQPGYTVATNLLDGLGLLPTSLPPFGSLTAAFLLSPDAGAEHAPLPAKLAPSALVVEYSVDSKQQCGVAAVPLGPVGAVARGAANGGSPTAAAARGLGQTPGSEALELLGNSESSSPRKAAAAASVVATATASSGGGGSSPTSTASGGEAAVGGADSDSQHCCFRHRLTLEMPSSESSADGALVLVRLLGPFVATLGQPTTLCWRLERSGPPAAAAGGSDGSGAAQEAPAAAPASRISFEVLAESDAWRPLGRRFGGVTLAGHPGAVATVEATWVPLASGSLPVPVLSLQDVGFQEVYDAGLSLAGTNAITVVEPTSL